MRLKNIGWEVAKRSGFTLMEVMAAMVVIAILMGIIIGAAGPVKKMALRRQASAEISALFLALKNYQLDNGDYPVMTEIPLQGDIYQGNPDDYIVSAMFLFSELCRGGVEGANFLEPAESGVTIYFEPKGSQVGSPDVDSYLQDPFRMAYGYYYSRERSEKSLFNVVEPDLWSTAGLKETPLDLQDEIYLQWITNWPN
ncbi:MAG: prepilin-type N-terminal cleavage/methylation domain-containing protein [Verrucomicrobiota bacterium]